MKANTPLETLVQKFKDAKSSSQKGITTNIHPIINKDNFRWMSDKQITAFQEWERRLMPQIRDCESPEEIQDIFFDSQKSSENKLAGIGDDSIISYSYHYANLNDMPISSSCCICLLTRRMKSNVRKIGITRNDKISDIKLRFPGLANLNDYEIIDFLRKYSSKL